MFVTILYDIKGGKLCIRGFFFVFFFGLTMLILLHFFFGGKATQEKACHEWHCLNVCSGLGFRFCLFVCFLFGGAYILHIRPTDVIAKARCRAVMLSGKGHSVALFNVSYSHRPGEQTPVALGQAGYCLACRCILSPPLHPHLLLQADAMEFSGHDLLCHLRVDTKAVGREVGQFDRVIQRCVPSLQMDSHQHLTVVQFQ